MFEICRLGYGAPCTKEMNVTCECADYGWRRDPNLDVYFDPKRHLSYPSTFRMVPIPPRPDLDELLRIKKKQISSMSPEEVERMLNEQSKSWARQDKD